MTRDELKANIIISGSKFTAHNMAAPIESMESTLFSAWITGLSNGCQFLSKHEGEVTPQMIFSAVQEIVREAGGTTEVV